MNWGLSGYHIGVASTAGMCSMKENVHSEKVSTKPQVVNQERVRLVYKVGRRFPDQKVQRPFLALCHLQADLQGNGFLHGEARLQGTAQVHAMRGYLCGTALPRCRCVGGSVT